MCICSLRYRNWRWSALFRLGLALTWRAKDESWLDFADAAQHRHDVCARWGKRPRALRRSDLLASVADCVAHSKTGEIRRVKKLGQPWGLVLVGVLLLLAVVALVFLVFHQ
jgi:hypothetical protein